MCIDVHTKTIYQLQLCQFILLNPRNMKYYKKIICYVLCKGLSMQVQCF